VLAGLSLVERNTWPNSGSYQAGALTHNYFFRI
jgi:hypothetical protein